MKKGKKSEAAVKREEGTGNNENTQISAENNKNSKTKNISEDKK